MRSVWEGLPKYDLGLADGVIGVYAFRRGRSIVTLPASAMITNVNGSVLLDLVDRRLPSMAELRHHSLRLRGV